MTTGDMYDEFFGDGFWERGYKPHIVAFADKCIAASKSEEPAPSASGNRAMDAMQCLYDLLTICHDDHEFMQHGGRSIIEAWGTAQHQ